MFNIVTPAILLVTLIACIVTLDIQSVQQGLPYVWDTTAWVVMGLVHFAVVLVIGVITMHYVQLRK